MASGPSDDRHLAGEEEDFASNSSTSTESLVDCNTLNWPYFNAPSVFPETTDHSTTSSDESLYVGQLYQIAREFSDDEWAEEFRGAALLPAEEQAWMKLKGAFCPPGDPAFGYSYLCIPEGTAPPAGGTYLPASSWEPMVPDTGTSEDTIGAKAPPATSPSSGYDPQPTMKSGASEPAKNMSCVQPTPAFRSGNLPNYVVKNAPFAVPLPPPGLPFGIPPKACHYHFPKKKPPPPLPNMEPPPNLSFGQTQPVSGPQPSTMQVPKKKPPPLHPMKEPPPLLKAAPAYPDHKPPLKSPPKAMLMLPPKQPPILLPKGPPKKG